MKVGFFGFYSLIYSFHHVDDHYEADDDAVCLQINTVKIIRRK